MKQLLILAVVLFGIWLWRGNRESAQSRKRRPAKPDATPLDMICCTLCSVHVPSADAVQGRKGSYCGLDHLHRAEP
jgi:uncharacterized protein